ncbi:hypothetical protein LEMLEM_LOCUS11709 [Lemmus lemmus]
MPSFSLWQTDFVSWFFFFLSFSSHSSCIFMKTLKTNVKDCPGQEGASQCV